MHALSLVILLSVAASGEAKALRGFDAGTLSLWEEVQLYNDLSSSAASTIASNADKVRAKGWSSPKWTWPWSWKGRRFNSTSLVESTFPNSTWEEQHYVAPKVSSLKEWPGAFWAWPSAFWAWHQNWPGAAKKVTWDAKHVQMGLKKKASADDMKDPLYWMSPDVDPDWMRESGYRKPAPYRPCPGCPPSNAAQPQPDGEEQEFNQAPAEMTSGASGQQSQLPMQQNFLSHGMQMQVPQPGMPIPQMGMAPGVFSIPQMGMPQMSQMGTGMPQMAQIGTGMPQMGMSQMGMPQMGLPQMGMSQVAMNQGQMNL